jgi:hypothetical protein
MRRLDSKLGFPLWLPLLLGVALFWVGQFLAGEIHHARHRATVPVHAVSYRLINT